MSADKITSRQKIIASAKILFSTHGFGQTSIEDIITAAGITKGAFYHYFKSKEAVCIEIIDGVQNDYQNIFQSLSNDINPLEKLKTAILRLLELSSSGQWIDSKLMLRLSCESRLTQTAITQKSDVFWNWYIGQYGQLIKECRDAKLINSRLSAAGQVDLIMNVLIGNIWTLTVFDRTVDKKVIDYIFKKLLP